MRVRAVLAAIAAVLCMAAAADPSERLPDPAQEARARHIFEQVRCLVCQNESIDDSEAELARDLRGIVRDQVRQGRSDDQIKHFLVDRYGEFVLMRPTFSAGNAALWLGPFLVVALGGILLVVRLRSRAAEPELDEADAERLRRLTDEAP
ncbi:MAG: cycL [Phenylobacterium sp.]|nr:cycL [Phenylobacterium sp.]